MDRNTQYARVLSFLDIEDDLNMREFFESEVKAERILNRNWREAFAHPAVMSKFKKIHGQLESEGIPTRLFD